jgi:hypothetical protein
MTSLASYQRARGGPARPGAPGLGRSDGPAVSVPGPGRLLPAHRSRLATIGDARHPTGGDYGTA